MSESDLPWPEFLHRYFKGCIAVDIEEGVGVEDDTFFGPMTRLVFTLFYAEDHPYDVSPLFRPSRSRKHPKVPTILVEAKQHPIFFLQIKSPGLLADGSKRQEADEQMRRKFEELGPLLNIPTLYGVSAFGTRVAFYEYDRATRDIQPTQADGCACAEQKTVNQPAAEVAPIERWDSDVLEKEGADRLKDIARRVKDMCTRD